MLDYNINIVTLFLCNYIILGSQDENHIEKQI